MKANKIEEEWLGNTVIHSCKALKRTASIPSKAFLHLFFDQYGLSTSSNALRSYSFQINHIKHKGIARHITNNPSTPLPISQHIKDSLRHNTLNPK